MRLRCLTFIGALAVAVAVAPAALAARADPENNAKAAPEDDAGYFIGTQGPTYSWHGCTGDATQRTLSAMQNPIPGEPPITKGARQKAVKFTLSPTEPLVSWKARPGWRICGAQATVVLRNPTVDARLWTQIGYASGRTSGSTSPAGGAEPSVTIPKGSHSGEDYKQFDGKTFEIDEIRAVTIFLKKKR